MSYTPPGGSSGDVSWNPSPLYSPPDGQVAAVSWQTKAVYILPHPWSVDVTWNGVGPYEPYSDTSTVDVTWSTSAGGYTARRGDEVTLDLGELIEPGNPLELVLGQEFVATVSDDVTLAGTFQIVGAGNVEITYLASLVGTFRLAGSGSIHYFGESLGLVFGVGEGAAGTLVTDLRFASPMSGGEGSSFTLSTTPSLPVAFSTGESQTTAVQRRIQPDPSFSHGQALILDLTIQSTQTQFHEGVSLSSALDVYRLFPATAADGATLGVVLATTTSIPIVFYAGEASPIIVDWHPTSYPSVTFSHGEVSSTVVEWHATSYPAVTFSHGESLSSDLYVKRTALMTVTFGVGCSVTSATALPARADIAVNFWTAETFYQPTISAAPHLGAVSIGHGESASFTLGEMENYRVRDGQSMVFDLNWSPSVNHGYSTGENFVSVLDTRPGYPFNIAFWNGESSASINMEIMVATSLAVTFECGVWIESCFDDATNSYDLDLPCCGPEVGKLPGESEMFELEDEIPATVRLPGVKLLVTCELSVRPRFQIAFGTGESFTAVERNIDFVDLEPIQQSGFWPEGDWLDVTPNHNLCYPNFIPDGDSIVVELEYEDEGCYADYVHAGESMSCVLKTSQGMQPGRMGAGESMWFDLNIRDPYLKPRFYAGEHLWQGNFPADIQPVFRVGEMVVGTFETPTYNHYTGESLEVALTLTYDVEFLEVGCLDNEYRYMNEWGDEDKSKFNEVSVELEPYFHQIKARCY